MSMIKDTADRTQPETSLILTGMCEHAHESHEMSKAPELLTQPLDELHYYEAIH